MPEINYDRLRFEIVADVMQPLEQIVFCRHLSMVSKIVMIWNKGFAATSSQIPLSDNLWYINGSGNNT